MTKRVTKCYKSRSRGLWERLISFYGGDDGSFIGFIEVGVGFGDLFEGVADEVCDDGEVGTEVDDHRDKGVAQVVDADGREMGGCGVGVKGALEGGWGDGTRASEEERGHWGVGGEEFGERGADGGLVDFLGFGGVDGVEGAVNGIAVKGLGEVDFSGGHVLGSKGEDFATAATGEEEGCEEGGVHGGIDGGEESVELGTCPKFHLSFGGAAFGGGDFGEMVREAVASFEP